MSDLYGEVQVEYHCDHRRSDVSQQSIAEDKAGAEHKLEDEVTMADVLATMAVAKADSEDVPVTILSMVSMSLAPIVASVIRSGNRSQAQLKGQATYY